MTDFDPTTPTTPGSPDPGSPDPGSSDPGSSDPGSSDPNPVPPPQPSYGGYGLSPSEQRNWATGAHLSALVLAFFGGLAVLGPLIVYLIKKDEDTFVAEHSREALNFQLTWLIGGFVGLILGIIVALLTVGIGLIVLVPAAIGLFIAWIVFTVKGAMAASRGEYYRYPMSVRLVS